MPETAEPVVTPQLPENSSRASGWSRLAPGPRVKRVLRNIGIGAAASIGLLAIGFASGWVAANNFAVSTSPVAIETPTTDKPADEFTSSILMPDVRGLTPDEAGQVLADAGIDIEAVTQTEQPAAGESGLVIAQTPAFGAGDPPVVSLTISAEAKVPDVIGKSDSDAIALLNTFGGQIDRQPVYVPGAALGEVIDITPAAGKTLPEIVTIRVTAAPVTVNLSTLEFDGSCSNAGSVLMDGTDWTDAVSCSSSIDGLAAEWLLNKKADEVTGTLGFSDDAETGSSATVQVIADGKTLGTYPLTSGTVVPFTLPATGTTKLTLHVQSTDALAPEVIVGDFTALGSAAAIATLVGP